MENSSLRIIILESRSTQFQSLNLLDHCSPAQSSWTQLLTKIARRCQPMRSINSSTVRGSLFFWARFFRTIASASLWGDTRTTAANNKRSDEQDAHATMTCIFFRREPFAQPRGPANKHTINMYTHPYANHALQYNASH